MARKDKPYLALYVQDLLTDERLINCSPSSHGIYLRLLCILHKQETYGKILLKQKHKQTDKQIKNFASYIKKQMPFSEDEILAGLTELLEEGVISINEDCLFQKRMVNDYELSVKRGKSGSEGGKKTQLKNKKFAKAKVEANSDIDIDIDSDTEDEIELSGRKFKLNEVGELPEIKIGAAKQLLKITKGVDKTDVEIIELWGAFKIQNVTGKKYYKSIEDIESYFLNWLQTKKINGTHQQTFGKSGGKSAGAEQLADNLAAFIAAGIPNDQGKV